MKCSSFFHTCVDVHLRSAGIPSFNRPVVLKLVSSNWEFWDIPELASSGFLKIVEFPYYCHTSTDQPHERIQFPRVIPQALIPTSCSRFKSLIGFIYDISLWRLDCQLASYSYYSRLLFQMCDCRYSLCLTDQLSNKQFSCASYAFLAPKAHAFDFSRFSSRVHFWINRVSNCCIASLAFFLMAEVCRRDRSQHKHLPAPYIEQLSIAIDYSAHWCYFSSRLAACTGHQPGNASSRKVSCEYNVFIMSIQHLMCVLLGIESRGWSIEAWL